MYLAIAGQIGWSATPQYRILASQRVITPKICDFARPLSFNNDGAFVVSFSPDSTQTSLYSRMFMGADVLNIGQYWGQSIGSEGSGYRNNLGVFAGGNHYKMTLDAPFQSFPTSLGYSYFECNGITDTGWIYGQQRGIGNDSSARFTDAYNVYTGQRLFPFGSAIRRMSNNGVMLVESLEPKFGDPRISLLKNGVTTVFGDFDIEATPFNDLDQFAGVIGSSADTSIIDKPVFWDGTTFHFLPIQNFFPHGIANSGRIIGASRITHRKQIYENGQIYDLIDHTNGWDAGMSIYSLMTRPDGDIAVLGRKGTDFYAIQLQSVPEPLTLFGLGAGLALVARRRR